MYAHSRQADWPEVGTLPLCGFAAASSARQRTSPIVVIKEIPLKHPVAASMSVTAIFRQPGIKNVGRQARMLFLAALYRMA
jgi:hypothetical protein